MMNVPPLAEFASALVVKPSSLGDIVHTLPSVHAIKQAHPRLKLRWVVKPEWRPLLEEAAAVDGIIDYPQREFRGLAGKARAAAWAYQLNRAERESPEIVLDFQGLLRSAMIASARGSRPIVGLSDAREGSRLSYDHVVPVDASAHAVDRYLTLVRALGVPVASAVFPLPGGEPVAALEGQRFVVIHPWSRGRQKSLGTHELQVLCDCLTTTRVVIVGVHASPPALRGGHITDLTNQTSLMQLIWIMRAAGYVISVDSGPMHIAAAVNPGTLSIHTWSDPRRVGPYQPECLVWKAGRIAHTRDFSAGECGSNSLFGEGDARRVADAALRRLRG